VPPEAQRVKAEHLPVRLTLGVLAEQFVDLHRQDRRLHGLPPEHHDRTPDGGDRPGHARGDALADRQDLGRQRGVGLDEFGDLVELRLAGRPEADGAGGDGPERWQCVQRLQDQLDLTVVRR